MATEITRPASPGPVGNTGPRLLRVDEVADHLSCSISMVFKLVSLGELRSVRIGRAVRIRPVDLEAYIDGAVRDT